MCLTVTRGICGQPHIEVDNVRCSLNSFSSIYSMKTNFVILFIIILFSGIFLTFSIACSAASVLCSILVLHLYHHDNHFPPNSTLLNLGKIWHIKVFLVVSNKLCFTTVILSITFPIDSYYIKWNHEKYDPFFLGGAYCYF